MFEWIAYNLRWMYWTVPTGLFFAGIFITIGVLSVAGARNPDAGRKGFLPLVTTRGDRFFIGVISAFAIHFIWIAVFGTTLLWVATAVSAAWFTVESIWG
jgi:predicted small integral membrane protein